MHAFLAWAGWPIIGEFVKLVPGVVLFPLTLLLAWKKVGNKALISYSVSWDQYTASGLSDIALTNCKDKPLVVHAIYIVIDRHILVPLKEFRPPLVVKGLESAPIECDPVSAYYVGHDPFEFDFLNNGEIYITTAGGRIKCELDQTPSTISIAMSEKYQLATRSISRYNGHVYDHRVRYALVFLYQGTQHTAFVGVGGHIGLQWPFPVNALHPDDMTDAATLKHVIHELYGTLMTGPLYVHPLNARIKGNVDE
jgi:hypothetical protein